jgi:hypothetical protein
MRNARDSLTTSGGYVPSEPSTAQTAESLLNTALPTSVGTTLQTCKVTRVEAAEFVVNATKSLLIVSLFLCCGNVSAQSADVEEEPAAVIEIGGAAAQSLKGGGSSFGPTIAVEVTPIENWLELEAGVTPLLNPHSIEWDTDLLFKKPWTLSDKAEFMFGAGPEWIHTNEHHVVTNSVGGEVVLDFMFWPSAKHKFGWYLEPGYDYNFGRGHEQSVGVSGGLLIALAR